MMVLKLDVNEKEHNGTLQEVKYVPSDESEQYKPENKSQSSAVKPDTAFLYFTIILGLSPLINAGSHMVWLSSAYASLLSNSSDVNPLERPASTAEISMIGGLPVLVGMAGPLFMIKLSEKTGRKMFMQIAAFGLFFTNFGMVFATQSIHILISRCALSCFMNSYIITLQVYISEVCENHNRAKFICIMGICIPIGNIFSYYFGPILHYRMFTGILNIPLLPFLVFFFFATETPVYLLSRNKEQECLKVLKRLRNNKNDKELQLDLDQIREALKATKSKNDKSILQLFKTRESRIAVFLTTLLSAVQHLNGLSTVTTFLGPLLNETGTKLSENTMTVGVSICQAASTLTISFIVQKAGRKTWLMWSSVGCGVSCFFLGSFYYLRYSGSSLVSSLQWLPLVSVITYTITFSIGLGPIPITLINEIFSSDLISAGVTYMITIMNVIVFLMISAFPFLIEICGFHWCVWIFSMLSFLSVVLVYFLVPETKGLNIIEIQKILKNYYCRK